MKDKTGEYVSSLETKVRETRQGRTSVAFKEARIKRARAVI